MVVQVPQETLRDDVPRFPHPFLGPSVPCRVASLTHIPGGCSGLMVLPKGPWGRGVDLLGARTPSMARPYREARQTPHLDPGFVSFRNRLYRSSRRAVKKHMFEVEGETPSTSNMHNVSYLSPQSGMSGTGSAV